ncbi:RNA-binding domain-containing protein [Schizopora paradoxa]|uniref:RNA-binding domain-containing protein n=1 Tax=Schizopora paradoxa TaxID=27342 RepID=A0A0H2S194_9AGAM|nr:RNA-binding domain-containing protein [Schizopora paradoxa]
MATNPNTTLYINNLNDKVNKEELKSQLFALFMTYGRVIDVVAQKGTKMRGQAFLVFSDLAEATSAMRACEGMLFYDKPLRIHYAKTKSHAALRREDPDFVPPNKAFPQSSSSHVNGTEKRSREDDDMVGGRTAKREKAEDDDEEMEMDEDDEGEGSKKAASATTAQDRPSARLLCTNLPQEVTDDVLGVLFQQYKGFASTQVAPNATGTKTGYAFFDSPELASVAKEALDGFTLKKGWKMGVSYT